MFAEEPSLDYCGTMTVYADLLRYRELFANLFRRDFQAKYKGSILGVFWSLLNPLVLLAVYLVVFGLLFQNTKIPHYPIYLLAGLACWLFFSVSLQTAARSMIDSAELIKKVRFPRQLVAFSMVATQAVTFVVMVAILIVLSLVFVPEARTTVWTVIPLAVLFAGARRRARAPRRLRERALPRRRAHPDRGAAAVVLPDADPLVDRDAAGEGEAAHGAARRAALGQPGRAADLRRARRALVGQPAAARGRRLPDGRRRARARCSARSSSAASTTASRSSSS